jgi:hypothetical protein
MHSIVSSSYMDADESWVWSWIVVAQMSAEVFLG